MQFTVIESKLKRTHKKPDVIITTGRLCFKAGLNGIFLRLMRDLLFLRLKSRVKFWIHLAHILFLFLLLLECSQLGSSPLRCAISVRWQCGYYIFISKYGGTFNTELCLGEKRNSFLHSILLLYHKLCKYCVHLQICFITHRSSLSYHIKENIVFEDRMIHEVYFYGVSEYNI